MAEKEEMKIEIQELRAELKNLNGRFKQLEELCQIVFK